MDKIIFKCFDNGDNQYFWCPFCKRNHLHGTLAGDNYKRDNLTSHHKESHCNVFKETGYYTKNYSKLELQDIKKVIDFMLKNYN